METLTFVILEDEEAHFSLMKRAIAKDLPHAAVYHFQDPMTCLKRLNEIAPTAIITDYLMPGLNGIEFLETLNQQQTDIPVIMVTGQGDENIAVRAMKLGAKDYLVKSENFFTLLPSVLEKVVREKKIKDALREVEEKYRLVVENAEEGIVVLQDGILKFYNPKTTEILGCTAEELSFKLFIDFVHPDDKEMVIQRHQKKLSGKKKPEVYDFRVVDKDGNIKWLRNNVVVIDWENEPATLKFLTDITDRKWADEHIRTLTQELMKYQENERHMISRELHDSIAQDLSSLKIGCDTLFDHQPAIPDNLRQKASEFSQILHKIITNVRDLSYLLRPPGLNQLGLVQSISQYCEDFSEKSGLNVDFTFAGMDALKLDNTTNINIYRLVQEGLNNIRKHADTLQATIKLISAYPNIILTIEDDGRGFDIEERLATHKKRMGLQSMQERAMLLGGKIAIQSQPGKGTKIVVKVPCTNK